MSRLPVIAGFGGINAAGRSSFHHGFRRLVLDALAPAEREATIAELARLMKLGHADAPDAELAATQEALVLKHTLMRRIEPRYFDVNAMPSHKRLHLEQGELVFRLRRRDLPNRIPANWQLQPRDDGHVDVRVTGSQDILVADAQTAQVSSAGQLPTGFDPEQLYPSRHHPRALQMTVFGASDALHSMGHDVDALRQRLRPDRMAVYAASAHGQLDDYGTGGLFKFPWQGRRTTSKQCPLGFAEMPADFINAYVLGSAGRTAGILGACATFLYNLERAVEDIRNGLVDFALVGATEAPITMELMEGYRAMGALGEDAALLQLDHHKGLTQVDNTRATRPFGYNAGFTMAESAQFVVLTSDELALELGLDIHGAVPGVFVHADGYKKSISSPGIGNYLTLGKAASLTRALLGEQALRQQSYIQAHGTGTPQNRVTESHVLNEIAGSFGISDWLVASIKCYVGHSLGAAAGDQFMAALGTWQHGIVPGIFTLDEIAHDVHRTHLRFSQAHVETGHDMQACFINAKGFGGNNATAVLMSPDATLSLLRQKHGNSALLDWQKRLEPTREAAARYDATAHAGNHQLRYRFGQGVVNGEELSINEKEMRIPGFTQAASFETGNPFGEYVKK